MKIHEKALGPPQTSVRGRAPSGELELSKLKIVPVTLKIAKSARITPMVHTNFSLMDNKNSPLAPIHGLKPVVFTVLA